VEPLPDSPSPLLVRTDFSDAGVWRELCDAVSAPVPDHGYQFFADMAFLDDPAHDGEDPDRLLAMTTRYTHRFLVIADAATMTGPERPLLVLGLREPDRGRTFRALPSTIQSIENNLTLANMDFREFADAAGPDGVFRGF
jgi:hypothetical protein